MKCRSLCHLLYVSVSEPGSEELLSVSKFPSSRMRQAHKASKYNLRLVGGLEIFFLAFGAITFGKFVSTQISGVRPAEKLVGKEDEGAAKTEMEMESDERLAAMSPLSTFFRHAPQASGWFNKSRMKSGQT